LLVIRTDNQSIAFCQPTLYTVQQRWLLRTSKNFSNSIVLSTVWASSDNWCNSSN